MENLLISTDAIDFLSRIPDSMAKLVYLDPPVNFNEIYGPSCVEARTYSDYLSQVVFHSRCLLRQDGFLAINLPHHYRVELQAILEDIFGKQNHIAEIIIPNRRMHSRQGVGSWHTSILIYGKSDLSRVSDIFRPLDIAEQARFNKTDARGPFATDSLQVAGDRPALSFEFKGFTPRPGRQWKYSLEKLQDLEREGRILFHGGLPSLKRYLHELNGRKISNIWDDIDQFVLGRERVGYPTQQSIAMMRRLLQLLTTQDDLIVDPFCGSGTSIVCSLDLGINCWSCEVDAEAISVVQERLRGSNLLQHVSVLSRQEFHQTYKQLRPPKFDIFSFGSRFKKSVSSSRLIKDKFRRRVAFVIGLENYMSRPASSLSRVHYAENDAKKFKEVLISVFKLNESDISFFISDKADKNSIKYELIQAMHSLTSEDQFILYYAGHGFQANSENYLTTYDSHPFDIVETSLSLQDDILIRLQESKCKSGIFFVDACATTLTSNGARSFLPSFDGREFEVLQGEGEYFATFLSCGRGQSSYPSDALKHGIWTFHLIEALSGRETVAVTAGKYITDRSLMRYLNVEVPKTIEKEYGAAVKQSPRTNILSVEETVIVELEVNSFDS
jgi:16S rRNA G966 N2-methylase RsmD/uncharacterized protein YpiB (UPF0302 family)